MRLLILLVFASLTFYACQPSGPVADTIYHNARIWTGDSKQPSASVLGVKDGKVLFVGEDYEGYQGPETELIDVEGRLLIPGFIDNHTHFLAGGFQLARVELRSA